jgi:AraC-like DNA-binding protein
MACQALAERVDRVLKRTGGSLHDAASGLYLLRETQPTAFDAMVYDPIVCLILQGQKETTIGERVFTVAQGQCVVVSHDVPVLARITQASADEPYLALVISLDLAVLRSLYDEVGDASLEPGSACCMEVAPVDAATVNVITRYLDLLDDAAAARVLLPLVRKELHFRLYMSASGAMLRSLLHRDSHASHVSHAIQMLRANFREHLAVDDLAKSAGMSASSFHRHFRAVTMTTPLQYQKDLRLTEARRLLRAGQHSVSAAAFEVGYESPSQFSREYARKFGAPPRGELSEWRAASEMQPV